MYCNKCGKNIPNGSLFCPVCGAQQQAQNTAAGQYQAPQNQNQSNVPYQTYTRRNAKKKGCLRFIIIALLVLAALWLLSQFFGVFSDFGGYYEESSTGSGSLSGVEGIQLDMGELREHYTVLKGGGEDAATIMVYMIGSDLESQAGMATNDLAEMYYSKVGGNVNLIVQTGGASQWHVDGIDSRQVQRWQVTEENIFLLEDVGRVSMVESSTVTDFVNYCAENFPADRYSLIFWDHGGGTAGGFGSDELYPDGSLALSDIDEALSEAGVKFDFVGFDACLMGTVETAYMLEEHADYLIASEELEPGEGWKYDGWLPALVENSSIETVELGKLIVDSFISESGRENTLSVVELREIPYTYERLSGFLSSAEAALQQRDYRTITNALRSVRSYNDGESDMIDIVDFASRTGLEGSEELIAAVQSCVKYRNNCSVSGSNGLSMYFPYVGVRAYSATRSTLTRVGMSESYFSFFDSFVSLLSGRQASFGDKSSVASSLGGSETSPEEQQTDLSSSAWYDPELVEEYQSVYAEAPYNEIEVVWSEEHESWVYPLTEEEWEDIDLDRITMEVLVDLEDSYMDLGSDQSLSIEDGNLLIAFDGTWVAIEGQIVPFYMESSKNGIYIEGESSEDEEWYSYGYVPAVLTRGGESTDIEIILNWNNENPSGYCAGYRLYSGVDQPVGRELLQFAAGDLIEYCADFYDKSGNYEGSYTYGASLTVTEDMIEVTSEPYSSEGAFSGSPAATSCKLEVSYEDIGEAKALVQFRIVDVFQAVSYTEPVEFS
ncbi:MAG: clostripain-related cysteine peptidase [Oscillospiraceae bacterium]|nr:clostripain-related cysteine peptidase [Oscillospiraceae bacterium]